jgi:O-antigen ligase
VYPNASLQSVTYWSALAIAFWAALTAFEERAVRHAMLTGFGALASVIAWVAMLQPYAGRLGIDSVRSVASDAFAGSFANRNMYACFAELALPVLLWLGVRSRRSSWAWLLNAGVLVASVINSGSRAGAILIVAECLVFVIVNEGGRKIYWKLAFGAAVLCIAVTASTYGDGTLAVRLQYDDPLVFRRDIYRSGLEMASSRPFVGFGLGTFSSAYPAYALFDNSRFVNLAHNDWLQLAVEGGVVTFGVFACFCLLLWNGVRQSIWALGIPIVLVHAFVDFPMHRIGVAAWWMVLAGAARAKQPFPPDRSRTAPESTVSLGRF